MGFNKIQVHFKYTEVDSYTKFPLKIMGIYLKSVFSYIIRHVFLMAIVSE